MDNADDGFLSSTGEIIDEMKVENEQITTAMCLKKCKFQHKIPQTNLKAIKAVTSCEKHNVHLCIGDCFTQVVINCYTCRFLFTIKYTFKSQKSVAS